MLIRKHTRFAAIVTSHLKKLKGAILLAVACALGSSAMALLAPWPLKLIFDNILLGKPLTGPLSAIGGVVQPGSVSGLVALSLALVLIALFAGIFSYYQLFLTSRIGNQLVYTLRSELVNHLQRLSLSFHNRARSGELLTHVASETNMLRDVYAQNALTAAGHVVTIVAMFAVMAAIDWKCGLLVLSLFPLMLMALFLVLRRLRKSAKRQRKKDGALASRISEMLSSVNVMQAFGRERYELQRFERESARSMEQSIRTARIQAAASRLVEIVTAAGTCMVLLYGGMQVLRGEMSPGSLLVFASYIATMYRPVRAMARLSARAAQAAASVERLTQILEIKPEIEDDADAIEARGVRGDIVFENVSFGYERGKPVLKNVSFRIPAGRRVALVGASGAGKSTIANLILRLYDPSGGRVLIDGIDVRRYRRESLRHEIGTVLQDNVLLGASIRENIAYGKPDATQEEIEQAAREALAHDFIAGLPEGYDEVIGEGGGTLSGGQRQRIGLARALIKRPPILIMDEPTSAVDAASEAAIRGGLRRMQQGRTMMVIAHQLYSVQDADWIIVLKNGRVVEQGTHDELAERGRQYCRLFGLERCAPRAA